MSTDARQSLAVAQANLLRALARLEPAPSGFDVEELAIASSSLGLKRSRAAEKAWPDFAMTLGDRFAELFTEYARQYPTPPPAGPAVDGFQFAEYLAGRDRLSDQARQILLAMRLHYRCGTTGIEKRRGPVLVWDRRPGSWRWRMRIGWL